MLQKRLLIDILGWYLQHFKLKIDSFQILRILQSIDVVLALYIRVIQKGIVGRGDGAIRLFTRQYPLVALRPQYMFAAFVAGNKAQIDKLFRELKVRRVASVLCHRQSFHREKVYIK